MHSNVGTEPGVIGFTYNQVSSKNLVHPWAFHRYLQVLYRVKIGAKLSGGKDNNLGAVELTTQQTMRNNSNLARMPKTRIAD